MVRYVEICFYPKFARSAEDFARDLCCIDRDAVLFLNDVKCDRDCCVVSDYPYIYVMDRTNVIKIRSGYHGVFRPKLYLCVQVNDIALALKLLKMIEGRGEELRSFIVKW